jgi:hypothetical protein
VYESRTSTTTRISITPLPPNIYFNNPHMHPQSGTGHIPCLANQSRA